MPEAHAATFEQIHRWFARDKDRVYFLHNVVEGADPGTFTVLGWVFQQPGRKTVLAPHHFEPSKAARNIRRIESKSLDRFTQF